MGGDVGGSAQHVVDARIVLVDAVAEVVVAVVTTDVLRKDVPELELQRRRMNIRLTDGRLVYDPKLVVALDVQDLPAPARLRPKGGRRALHVVEEQERSAIG